MVEIKINYDGQLRCSAVHGPSGATILTDAPLDNHGKGEAFSPTDLVATALGTCMMTVMAIAAEKNGIDLRNTRVVVQKEMVTAPTRRIGKLTVDLYLPDIAPEKRPPLERAAMTCPVHKSISHEVIMPVRFHWGQNK